MIATRCSARGLRLLHRDRDFDAFEKHLALGVVNCQA
jgi:predicted nucleic acid-binding protein